MAYSRLALRRYIDGKCQKKFIMQNSKKNKTDEAENFDVFIKAMVQAVEKYGRFVLQELDCVA